MKNVSQLLPFKNPIKAQLFDKDGNLKWEDECFNAIVTEGLAMLYDVLFEAGTAPTAIYIALMTDPVTESDADTYASHGYTENTDYTSPANRPAWVATTTGRAHSNGTTADFTMGGTNTIAGIAIVTDIATKGDTAGAGTLWATAKFSTVASVVISDVLKITYTVQG
jgi:hypothetical protein